MTAAQGLNQAADELIAAMEDVGPIRGFRAGLAPAILVARAAAADPRRSDHVEGCQALRVWRALDAMAAAVQERREAER